MNIWYIYYRKVCWERCYVLMECFLEIANEGFPKVFLTGIFKRRRGYYVLDVLYISGLL